MMLGAFADPELLLEAYSFLALYYYNPQLARDVHPALGTK